MDMTDWDIDDGHATFTFYEDGYDLCVEVCFEVFNDLIYHGAGGRHYEKTLDWGLDDHYLIGEDGLPLKDNAGMASFFYGAYVEKQIDAKLRAELM